MDKWIRIFIIGLVISAAIFGYEYKRNYWYYQDNPERCVIISKQIRMENKYSDSRNTQMEYNNHFIVRTRGGIVDIVVSNGDYYSKEVGDTAYYMLSHDTIFGSRKDGEEVVEAFAFLFGIIFLIAIFIRAIIKD